VAPYDPDDNLLDKYKVRVTPFMFMVDENGFIRTKGLVNSKGGLDMYYRELKTGKFEPLPEEPGAEGVVAQEAAQR
jgi:hypothetical protein